MTDINVAYSSFFFTSFGFILFLGGIFYAIMCTLVYGSRSISFPYCFFGSLVGLGVSVEGVSLCYFSLKVLEIFQSGFLISLFDSSRFRFFLLLNVLASGLLLVGQWGCIRYQVSDDNY